MSSAKVQRNSNSFKVVLLGSCAGKTALLKRFMHDSFDDDCISPTIGMDFQSKKVIVDDRSIRLQIWDTAGQERYQSLILSYLRDAVVGIVVYDVTERSSFESSQKWIEKIRNESGDSLKVVALVGSKVDLESERQVSTEEGLASAEALNARFCETSAKTGVNVVQLFNMIAAEAAAASPQQASTAQQASSTIQLQPVQRQSDSERRKWCFGCI